MSAALDGCGWMAEILLAFALTMAAAYWLLGAGTPAVRRERMDD